MTSVFSRITVLPELEEEHFTAERHFDDRQRRGGQRGSSWKPYHGGGRPYHGGGRPYHDDDRPYHDGGRQAGRHNSGFSQRFSSSSYWKKQASRGSRDKLWDSDDD